jgi:hypothetical protein
MKAIGNSALSSKVRQELATQDFAIVDLKTVLGVMSHLDGASIERGIVSLAEGIRIGAPFVPDLYKDSISSDYTQSTFNHVGGPARRAKHPAFSTQSELDLHTDGTLNAIGEVRLSILGCVSEAQHGGETVLFRASALAEHMMKRDCDVLAPFFDPRAMRRHTTVGEDLKYADGPILKWVDDELLASYCTTPRDEWRYDMVPDLREARRAFDAAILDLPEFTFTFLLREGQALVMDNSRTSHGRLSFSDNPNAPRHIIRALFRLYPSVE